MLHHPPEVIGKFMFLVTFNLRLSLATEKDVHKKLSLLSFKLPFLVVILRFFVKFIDTNVVGKALSA